MCGRFYVDDEMAIEVEKLVRNIDRDINRKSESLDIYPSNEALILSGASKEKVVSRMKWGFPSFKGNNLIINARSEGVLEKRMFSKSVLERRCLIPARGFYEWDKSKNKVTFQRSDSGIIYMAGIWRAYEDLNHFVILTTEANASMKEVHSRMPLILEKEELDPWLFDNKAMEFLLHKTPLELIHTGGYIQQSLF